MPMTMRPEDDLEPQLLHRAAIVVPSVCDERRIFGKVLQVEEQEFSENNVIKWTVQKHYAGAVRNFPASRIRSLEIDVGIPGLTKVVPRDLDQWIREID